MKELFIYLFVVLFFISCKSEAQHKNNNIQKTEIMKYKVTKSNQEWKAILSPAQFHVIREKGTEQPGTGEYNLNFKEGSYACAACGAILFNSNNKYESHCGWPSFDEAIEGTVEYKKDSSLSRIRTEILCANCGGHLGHVFDDGPKETTGKRFCVNSLSLKFKEEKK